MKMDQQIEVISLVGRHPFPFCPTKLLASGGGPGVHGVFVGVQRALASVVCHGPASRRQFRRCHGGWQIEDDEGLGGGLE